MISAEEAWSRLVPHLSPFKGERLPRRQSLGRILEESLAATVDIPALDVSAMDGYALAGEVAPEQVLPVAGTIAAGDPPGFELSPGGAARIMTGAPVPAAADRVVPVEETDGGGEEVRILSSCPAGTHIRRRGEILRASQELLEAGTLLTPGGLSLLAAHGYGEVPVRRRPTLAVLVTGDEVVPPDLEPRPGQLRDSHTDFLLAAGHSLGVEVSSLGIAGDRVEELAAGIRTGMESDVLLITGGVSMGVYDLVEGVLEELGARILFEKVAVQPAKPVVAAVHPGGIVFGLPGNPGSAMVAFWLFVRPVVRRLQGYDDGFWHGALAAELAAPCPGAKGRDRFLPARVRFEGGRILAEPVDPKGSHDVAAYALGTALLRIPAGTPQREIGASCEVLPLVDWRAG
ncbi:MAG: molybdopterin molybdotransferase MoeA [Acidobacteria bacterium]|nr:molybdopterin molybdotransferase MoeA [Acidobacteriota bacterium]